MESLHITGPSDGLRRGLGVVLLVALLISTTLCVLAWRSDGGDATGTDERAAARDEARAASVHDLEILMATDHRDAARTVDGWSSVTTGRLHRQLGEQRKALFKRLRQTQEVTTATTVEAALTSWDEAAGTARLIAVVELKTSMKGQDVKRHTVRYLAMTQRAKGAWRLSALQPLGEVS